MHKTNSRTVNFCTTDEDKNLTRQARRLSRLIRQGWKVKVASGHVTHITSGGGTVSEKLSIRLTK